MKLLIQLKFNDHYSRNQYYSLKNTIEDIFHVHFKVAFSTKNQCQHCNKITMFQRQRFLYRLMKIRQMLGAHRQNWYPHRDLHYLGILWASYSPSASLRIIGQYGAAMMDVCLSQAMDRNKIYFPICPNTSGKKVLPPHHTWTPLHIHAEAHMYVHTYRALGQERCSFSSSSLFRLPRAAALLPVIASLFGS